MTYLLDTCVVSEGSRPAGNAGLKLWLSKKPIDRQYLSVFTVAEIEFGILRLPSGDRRNRLEQWLKQQLDQDFPGRVLDFDRRAASAWAILRNRNANPPTVDSQIAAIAVAHDLTVVTRNVRDFAFPGLAVFNPWSK